ncbi:MAG: hypothetical protein V1928_00805 [Parcubacteria group bacterium]
MNESKYLTLWICVLIAAGVIFGGWFVSAKFDFNRTNLEMKARINQNPVDPNAEMQSVFDSYDQAIKQSEMRDGNGTVNK